MDLKDLLSTLVSHGSVFGNEKSLAEWCVWYLKKMGFNVQKQPVGKDRFNVLAKRGTGSSLLCYGHLDTVPVYSGWQTDPFSLTEKGDKLFGLGACDMKGGIAALLYAIGTLPLQTPVNILLAVDEENHSEGAWTLVNARDSWLKGLTHVLSTEPGASATKIGGADVLTLGRRGRARFILKIQGFSAHGGHIEKGINAISIANKVITRIEAMTLAKHPQLREGSHYIAKIGAASEGLSIPEYCEVEIERHLVLPETISECISQYQQICGEVLDSYHLNKELQGYVQIAVEIKKRKNKYMEPYETSQNDSFVQGIRALMEKNGKTTLNYGRSVGDENVFANEANLLPVIIGPEGKNIHSPNEWVSFASLEQCAKLYAQIMQLSGE